MIEEDEEEGNGTDPYNYSGKRIDSTDGKAYSYDEFLAFHEGNEDSAGYHWAICKPVKAQGDATSGDEGGGEEEEEDGPVHRSNRVSLNLPGDEFVEPNDPSDDRGEGNDDEGGGVAAVADETKPDNLVWPDEHVPLTRLLITPVLFSLSLQLVDDGSGNPFDKLKLGDLIIRSVRRIG